MSTRVWWDRSPNEQEACEEDRLETTARSSAHAPKREQHALHEPVDRAIRALAEDGHAGPWSKGGYHQDEDPIAHDPPSLGGMNQRGPIAA